MIQHVAQYTFMYYVHILLFAFYVYSEYLSIQVYIESILEFLAMILCIDHPLINAIAES